jgi:hypothetical protein
VRSPSVFVCRDSDRSPTAVLESTVDQSNVERIVPSPKDGDSSFTGSIRHFHW